MSRIVIDGSAGEGGGQIMRTSLSLAMCTGKPIRIENIRARRSKPGLMRQHLACVRAAAEVCGAEISNAVVGSTAIDFSPGKINNGEYHFVIGSAGSTTLLFQTVLPALMLVQGESKVILEGGTHNPLAPSYDFLRLTFLPVLNSMGVVCKTEISAYGFFPVGAGCWRATIKPHLLKSFDLEERGDLIGQEAVCITSKLPGHIARREKAVLLRKLGWLEDSVRILLVDSPGSGNVVQLRAHYTEVCQVIDSIGELGVRAEVVGQRAIDQLRRYKKSVAPVGAHLADQLLLPMAVGPGGSFVTVSLSSHAHTNIEVIKHFLDIDIEVDKLAEGDLWRVVIPPRHQARS